MAFVVASLRLTLAVAIVVAVVATAIVTASRGPLNPFNFFGYFTVQSNLLAAVALAASAITLFRRRSGRGSFVIVRAAVTTYMVIVGVVYGVLLAPLGAAGGVPLPWANTVLHVIAPMYIAVDWLVVGDRRALPFRRLALLLIYPAVWCAVVLVRGATDGWVPYPFLSPATGYGSVAFFVVLIALLVVGVGALTFWAGRFRGVLLRMP